MQTTLWRGIKTHIHDKTSVCLSLILYFFLPSNSLSSFGFLHYLFLSFTLSSESECYSVSLLSSSESLLTLRADQGEDRVTEMHVNDLKALIDSSLGRDRERGKEGEKSESGGGEEEGTC